MTALMTRLYCLLFSLCMLHTANSFVQLSQSRPRQALMAKKNRIKKAAGKIKDKLGLGPKVESSSESPAVTIPVKESPVSDKGYVKVGNAEKLSKKYAKIDDVGERAFQILLDLGLTS